MGWSATWSHGWAFSFCHNYNHLPSPSSFKAHRKASILWINVSTPAQRNTKIGIGVVFTMDLSPLIGASHSEDFNSIGKLYLVMCIEILKDHIPCLPPSYIFVLLSVAQKSACWHAIPFYRKQIQGKFQLPFSTTSSLQIFLFMSLSLHAFVCLIPSVKDSIFHSSLYFLFPKCLFFLTQIP